MNYKYKRKKGVSLIEVIISVAVLAILIIPLANSVIQSIKINKSSERKQMASFEGQKVLEEFKSYDNLTLNGNEFKLLNGKSMVKDVIDSDKYSGEFLYTKGRDKYNVKVLMEKNNDLRKTNINEEIACTIKFPQNGEFIIKKDGSEEIAKNFPVDVKDLIAEISNKEGSSQNYTIKFKYIDPLSRREEDFIEFTGVQHLDTEKVLINIGKDYTREINISVDNKAIDSSNNSSIKINILSNIEQAENERIRGNIKTESINGDVVIRTNRNAVTGEKIGDLYNINVQVELSGQVLFESSVAQNIIIK